MKLLVTAISLDFETDNDFYRVKPDEQIEIEQDVLGIWEVESEDDLVDKISDTIGSVSYTHLTLPTIAIV